MKRFLWIIGTLIVLTITPDTFGGSIFLSGDGNIAELLVGDSSTPGDSGNQQFFINILQGGSRVAVLKSTPIPGGSALLFASDINTFYGSFSGVTSNLISGTVNAGQLLGVGLFVAPIPDDAFSAAEISALGNLLFGGGSIFFLGENQSFSGQNSHVNEALSALGSGMSISPDSLFDPDYNIASGFRIVPDPYTADVATFTYAAASQVSGGKSLFYGTEGQPFVAYESAPVPEPASLLLLGTGLGIICLAVWRRRQKPAAQRSR